MPLRAMYPLFIERQIEVRRFLPMAFSTSGNSDCPGCSVDVVVLSSNHVIGYVLAMLSLSS